VEWCLRQPNAGSLVYLTALPANYAVQGGSTQLSSVRLSHSPAAAVGLLLWARRPGDINRLGGLKTRDWKSQDWKTRDQSAWVEIAGLENAGTPCAWVAKCNIINVRGHVRVNVIDGSPFDRDDVSTDDGASALVFATDDQLSFLRSAHVRRAGARQQMRAVPRCRLM